MSACATRQINFLQVVLIFKSWSWKQISWTFKFLKHSKAFLWDCTHFQLAWVHKSQCTRVISGLHACVSPVGWGISKRLVREDFKIFEQVTLGGHKLIFLRADSSPQRLNSVKIGASYNVVFTVSIKKWSSFRYRVTMFFFSFFFFFLTWSCFWYGLRACVQMIYNFRFLIPFTSCTVLVGRGWTNELGFEFAVSLQPAPPVLIQPLFAASFNSKLVSSLVKEWWGGRRWNICSTSRRSWRPRPTPAMARA
jgi:hypothetical protein